MTAIYFKQNNTHMGIGGVLISGVYHHCFNRIVYFMAINANKRSKIDFNC